MNFIQSDLTLFLDSDYLVKYFIKDVGLPSNQAPEALGLRPSQYMEWFSGLNPNKVIENKHLVSLGQYLSIDEISILNRTYDKDLIRSRLFASFDALPEKYSVNQFSYVRSSAHIIKFLTLTRGQHFSDMILRKLNVSPFLYSNLDNKISINYFVDLLEILAENGLSETELDNLAAVLFLSLEGTEIGNKFKRARNYFECYEVIATNVTLFDTNFDYTFELERNQVLIKSSFFFDKHYHILRNPKKMDRLIRYRQLLIGWYPFLSKLPPVLPEHTSKIFTDRIENSYFIKFVDKPMQLLGTPKDSGLHFL